MKVFCLGSNKTGTTSLERAVKKLGFSPIPSDKTYGLYLGNGLNHSKENMVKLFETFELRKYTYNYFRDIPFNLSGSYHMLYDLFPEAYYILLTRDAEKWFYSALDWIQLRECQAMYNWIWNIEFIPENKTKVIDLYHNRNNEIIQFFKHNPKFLLLSIEEENKYARLCNFLNKEIRDESFPHENRS